jgi:hypothetical protein
MRSSCPPDGRDFIVKTQLWHCSASSMSDEECQRLVSELMGARRAVEAAKASGDASEIKSALHFNL